mmetsp:Transcript_4637/g.14011  ORF Transcript_4637/g.14011 Transcript_4637/m.14011 type:complete len:80 (-) Transcript_4637:268-507(-)
MAVLRRREDGGLAFFGMTLSEWLQVTFALLAMYAFIAVFFAVVYLAAVHFRERRGTLERPGTEFAAYKQDIEGVESTFV